MGAARSTRRLKAANDGAAKKPLPLVSVITLAPNPTSIKRLAAASVLLVGLGLMGLSVWALQKTTEPLAVAPKTNSALAQNYTDIRLPASSLSPDTLLDADPAIDTVAAHLRTLPAFKASNAIQHDPSVFGTSDEPHDLAGEAQAALDTADYATAIGFYDQILAHHPHDHDALTGKVYALAKNGETDAALAASRALVAAYPHDHVAAVNLARLLATHGAANESLAVLDRAARATPDDLNVRLDLAAAYDRQQHPNEALMLYRQIVATAADRDDTQLPLRSIERRIDYLETLAGASPEPSTTLPVAN